VPAPAAWLKLKPSLEDHTAMAPARGQQTRAKAPALFCTKRGQIEDQRVYRTY
jgi:hypothetical protein